MMKPIYVPNTVDIDLFKPIVRKNNGKCYIRLKKNQTISQVDKLLKEHGINVKLETHNPVLHKDFPSLLMEYEYCCDIPMAENKIIQANSMVGLGAMAMGLKTIQHDFTIKDSLPKKHQPEYSIKLLREIYDSLYD